MIVILFDLQESMIYEFKFTYACVFIFKGYQLLSKISQRYAIIKNSTDIFWGLRSSPNYTVTCCIT